jgi:hypothetical protein
VEGEGHFLENEPFDFPDPTGERAILLDTDRALSDHTAHPGAIGRGRRAADAGVGCGVGRARGRAGIEGKGRTVAIGSQGGLGRNEGGLGRIHGRGRSWPRGSKGRARVGHRREG